MSDEHETQTKNHFELEPSQGAVIKVIGVGGCGGNAVGRLAACALPGVEFIAVNTDRQALDALQTPTLQIGMATTRGLGAGTNTDVGQMAAQEDRDQIQHALAGADMVFITVGMGGGTGTGAAPVVAQIAKGLDILTVAVVVKPFSYEGRDERAEAGIEEISQHADSLIVIPNDRLASVCGDEGFLEAGYAAADDVLHGAVQGIADIITRHGIVNVDFADVKTVMSRRGLAIMGTGHAAGEDRAHLAIDAAVNSPLLDGVSLQGAQGVVVNVTGHQLRLSELEGVGTTIRKLAAPDATIVIGTVIDPSMGEEMRVTVIATGVGGPAPPTVVVNNDRAAPKRAGRTDYDKLEQPAVVRRRAAGSDANPTGEPVMLNIPEFLNRQAD